MAKRSPRAKKAPAAETIVLVGMASGALESLDKARKGMGVPISRELLLSGLCHVAAMCFSKRAMHVALREMFQKALGETLIDAAEDEDAIDDDRPTEPLSPSEVRRSIHAELDAMAGYCAAVVDTDPGAAVSEISRIRQAVGPVTQKPHERRVQPGFDGRA